MDDQDNPLDQKKGDKQPHTYAKPEVTILGRLEELTQNVGSKSHDGLSGSQIL